MNLRDRLRSMRGTARADAAVAPAESPALPDAATEDEDPHARAADAATPVLPSAIGREQAIAAPDNRSAESLLPGRVLATPHGSCFVAEWRYPLDHRHGQMRLGAALETALDHAILLLTRRRDERVRLLKADPRRVVYLDTETTGLAGGTGTYAFLIGIGRYIGDEFVVRQVFMRDLHEEHAALHLLAQEMAGYEALVTYNGKAFDWPLLETRYALARRGGPAGPEDPAAHVDLLFSARRLWRARLENCTLGVVERELLGVRRGDDVSGWLIPQLYFAYLRDRDARPLAGVFRHNALDLLSLAALLGRVAAVRAVAPDGAADGAEVAAPADELLALGRCLEENGDLASALAAYQGATRGIGLESSAVRAAITREARLRAGAVLKRLRRGAEAVAHWESLLKRDAQHQLGRVDLRPYEELAKYYEHTAHDVERARAYVVRALAELAAAGANGATRDAARLRHRLDRLERAYRHGVG